MPLWANRTLNSGPKASGVAHHCLKPVSLVAGLNKRSQDSPDVIARRLAAARDEISHAGEFKYVIINDNFTEAARDLISIVRARRLLTPVQLARHSSLINRMKQGI